MSTTRPRLVLSLLLSSVLSPIFSAQAHAEDDERSSMGLSEIVVTARHRSEDGQKVPIGITTIDADQLAARGVTYNLRQLSEQLPSLSIQGFSGRNQTFSVRGIGTPAGGVNDGIEPGVGVYIDGVYRARPGAVVTDLLDVESVQLLRGPQGTLFGKNTVGGAVDIRTAEPGSQPELKAEVTAGSHDTYRAYVSATQPLGDAASLRVSYLHSEHGGYIFNARRNENWDTAKNDSVRGDLVWRPSDDLKLRLIADYSRMAGIGGFTIIDTVLPTTLANGAQVRGLYGRAQDVGYTPIVPGKGSRVTDLDTDNHFTMPSWGVQLQADKELAGATISSITAYRHFEWTPQFDADRTGANVYEGGILNTQQQFSQELRLTSTGVRTVDYTAGLYFFREKIYGQPALTYGRDAAAWLLTSNTPTATVSAVPSEAIAGLTNYADYTVQHYSYAAYGQATWHVAPTWRLTAGLRYTNEQKRARYRAYPAGNPVPISSLPAAIQATATALRAQLAPTDAWSDRKTDENVSGTVILAHDFAEAVSTYASYARGYKAAGVNLVVTNANIDRFVKPEKVDSFEIGLKSRLAGNRLELNLTAFWVDIANYQSNYLNSSVSPPVTSISNVGNVRSKGVELDLRAQPIDGLALSFSATYTDARYRNYHSAPPTYLYSNTVSQDLTGAVVSGVPHWALGGTVQYSRPVSADLVVYGGADASYRSGSYGSSNNDPYSWIGQYALLGLNAGIRHAEGRWDVQAWVRNLTDTYYNTTALVFAINGTAQGSPGDPRTWGATLRTRF